MQKVTAPSVQTARKQILVHGQPRILMSGEVHYFRLDRTEWADRLDKLVECGCNTVASYIPWLWHELPDGSIDMTGSTRPERDLGAFIDLCAERGLLFVARPGPFIMAELKNEGLPYRLYDEHPEIVPISWDGRTVPTRTVDYLAPTFLAESDRWLAAVMEVLAPRLDSVIAIQLDNEVGMLSWVSRSPDLTDTVLADFTRTLHEQYDGRTLEARYPFALDDAIGFARFRSPDESYALPLLRDLGHYMRERFARYFRTLRDSCEEHLAASGNYTRGDLPYLVNVHGTSDGRGATFPIGISQLALSYTGIPGMVGGSDHYLGDLNTRNAIDLYLINAFLDAVNDADQPLTSIEFEAGDGDYGQDLTHVHDPSTIDLKTRLCIAQGNRLLNYYLFTGGVNPPLDTPVGDGNDRISFTGERHGTGAPIGPEGQYGLTFPRTADVVRTTLAVERSLATMREEHDDLSMAYIPDYFMTESVYGPSTSMTDLVSDLERYRFGGPGQLFARALLLGGYRFGAVDIQHNPPTPGGTPLLALASARHLDDGLQHLLVDYLQLGGRLLLCGEVPTYDMEGKPCTVLMDALKLKPRTKRHGDHEYFLSVSATGWAAPRPEVRVGYAQLLDSIDGATFLRDVDSGLGCGFDVTVGMGRAIVVTTDYPGSDVAFYRSTVEALGVKPRLRHDSDRNALVVTSTANSDRERIVHVLNLEGYDSRFGLSYDGDPLFDGARVHLPGRSGVMLPIGLRLPGVGLLSYATAEIIGSSEGTTTFRAPGDEPAVIVIETAHDISVSIDGAAVSRTDGRAVIRLPAGLRGVPVQVTGRLSCHAYVAGGSTT